MASSQKFQLDKVAVLSGDLDIEDDEAAFDVKLREVAKHKPVLEKLE